MTIEAIEKLIITVSDFPKKGVQFKDITPVLQNSQAFKSLSRHFAEKIPQDVTQIVAIESRGFILGCGVAQYCNAGIVLARKPGKLPRATIKETYALEYGTDSLELHYDSFKKGEKIVIIDDVLATGGTAAAVEALCHKAGAQVVQSLFLMEIDFLNGAKKLKNPHFSFLHV
jgi:adenine phosphoribosyltransferase